MFDVLVNLFSNIDKLKADIADIKQDTASLTADQLKAARQLEDEQLRLDKLQQANAATIRKLRQDEIDQSKELAKQEAIVQAKRDDYAKKNLSGGAAAAANLKLLQLEQALVVPEQAKLAVIQSQKAAIEANVAALRVQEAQAQADYTAEKRRLQDLISLKKKDSVAAQTQVQETTAARQKLAGAGFALASSGIPGAEAVGTGLLAFSFGGPVAAGLAVSANLIAEMVKDFGSLVGLFKTITTTAFEFSQELETSKVAIASVIASSAILQDSNTGQRLKGQEAFNASLRIAGDLQEQLLAKVLKTNITYEEGNKAVQSSLGFLTARGINANDALEIIVRLTAAAKNLGIEGERAAFQVRSVVSGISSRSQLAGLLSASTDLKRLTGLQGDEAAAAWLRATSQIARGVELTASQLKVQIENVGDVIKLILGKAFSESFVGAGAELGDFIGIFLTETGKLTARGQELKNTFKDFFDQLRAVGETVLTSDNLKAFANLIAGTVVIATQLLTVLQKIAAVTFPQGLGQAVKNVGSKSEFVNSGIDLNRIDPNGGAPASTLERAQVAFSPFPQSDENNAVLAMFVSARQSGLPEKTAVDITNRFMEAVRKQAESDNKTKGVLDSILSSGPSATALAFYGAQFQKEIDAQVAALQTPKSKFPLANIVPHVLVRVSQDDLTNVTKINELESARVKIQEALAAGEENIKVQLGNTIVDAEAGIARLDKAITTLRSKEASIEASRERVTIINSQITANQELVKLVDQQTAAQEKVNTALITQVLTEEQLAALTEDNLHKRTEAAKQALQIALQNLDAQKIALRALQDQQEAFRSRTGNQPTNDNDRVAVERITLGLLEQQQKVSAASVKVAEHQKQVAVDTGSELLRIQQLSIQETNKAKPISDSINVVREQANERQTVASGTSGAAATELNLGLQSAKDTKQLDDISFKLDQIIIKKKALATDALAIGATTESGTIQAEVAGLERERASIDVIKQLETQILAIRIHQLDLQRELESIAVREATVNAEIANVQQQQSNLLISSVDAYNQIANLNAQLTKDELQKQETLRTQQTDLRQQLTTQQQIRDSSVAGSDAYKRSVVAIDDTNNQLGKVKTAIITSQTEVLKLADKFSTLPSAIAEGTKAMASFFDSIDLPKVGQLFTSLGKASSGFSQIFSKNAAGQNIFQQTGANFSRTKDSISSAFGDGGLGSVLGSLGGTISSAASLAGPIGSAISGVIGIFSALKSVFSQGAAHMAEAIQKSVTSINDALSSNSINLTTAIDELQAQLQQTFILQNKKGGADDAAKLQQQLNSQIASLKKQQTDILNSFNFTVALQNLGEGFNSFGTSLNDALTKITSFIGAGGSVQQAQTFLNQILAQYSQTLSTSINGEQQTAIQQAQSLLSLTQEQLDLDTQHSLNTQNILNQGLAARTLTFGQQKAQQLAQENANFDKQSQALQDQIDTTTALLNINKAVLDGTVDINDAESLKLDLLNLQVSARQQQFNIVKQQMELLAGILKDPTTGNFVISPDLFSKLSAAGLFNGTGVNVGSVTLNVQVNGTSVSTGGSLSSGSQTAINDMLQQLLGNDLSSLGLSTVNPQAGS